MAISDEGALRVATATLRASGGTQVTLRLPGLAVSGADAEQLGLTSPQFQDLPIGPAAWRKAGVNTALLIAGEAVAELVAAQGAASAESLLETAVGVVVSGVVYGIVRCEPLMAAGVACAYRLSVQEPAWT